MLKTILRAKFFLLLLYMPYISYGGCCLEPVPTGYTKTAFHQNCSCLCGPLYRAALTGVRHCFNEIEDACPCLSGGVHCTPCLVGSLSVGMIAGGVSTFYFYPLSLLITMVVEGCYSYLVFATDSIPGRWKRAERAVTPQVDFLVTKTDSPETQSILSMRLSSVSDSESIAPSYHTEDGESPPSYHTEPGSPPPSYSDVEFVVELQDKDDSNGCGDGCSPEFLTSCLKKMKKAAKKSFARVKNCCCSCCSCSERKAMRIRWKSSIGLADEKILQFITSMNLGREDKKNLILKLKTSAHLLKQYSHSVWTMFFQWH